MRRVAQARAGSDQATLPQQREPFRRNVALIYVHGGGWSLGDLDGREPVACVIAETTRCPVLEVEHRQAPEHPFPAPLDDVRAALRWALDHPDALQPGRVGAAVRDAYLAGADTTDPDASPLLAVDLASLPPTVVCVTQYDALRAQGLAYAQRLEAAGVPVTVVDAHGLDHAFLRGAPARGGRRRRSPRSARRCAGRWALNANDTAPSRLGCSLPRESRGMSRGFRAAGLATPGPRSLRLGSASRGKL